MAALFSRPRESFQVASFARYDDNGSPLLQGYLIGEKHLASKAAALDVAVDAGTSRCCDFDPSGTASRSALRARFNAVLNVVEH